MDLGIADKIAIVTGGGAGIGAQVCLALAREGVHQAVVDINLENAEKMAEEVRSSGVRAIALGVDVSELDQTLEMVEKTLSEFGRIDILNNLAGVAHPGFFQNSKKEHWENEINACLFGVMNCCKSVIDPMIEQKSGKIVNVASDAGKAGEKIMVSYSAAKAGIMGFTRSLAREMGRYWINVNAVCPGMTKGTGMTAVLNDELEKRLVKNYPLPRLGRPEDTTNLVLFLSSQAADWITGQAISVNGGYYMGG
jgi:NAD(P)-dependent dehydrogenase (short-subunit alcohol dehydrogenase family)